VAARPIFEIDEWPRTRGKFIAREGALIRAAAMRLPVSASRPGSTSALLHGRGLYAAAKAVADLVLSEARPGFEESTALMLRAIANILIDRHDQGLKDLANPVIAPISTRRCGGAGRGASGQMGGGARKIQECRIRPSPRCRSICSASCWWMPMRASLEVRIIPAPPGAAATSMWSALRPR